MASNELFNTTNTQNNNLGLTIPMAALHLYNQVVQH